MKKQAVIYTRVSTDDQAEHGFSLSAQLKSLNAYCIQHDIDIIGHYQDDHSAKNFNRPLFKLFISELEAKKIKPNLFLVTKIDRFSRKHDLTIGMITRLKKYGVEVRSISEGKIDFNSSESFLRNSIQSTFAEYDNIQRGENVTRGMREALKQGRWVRSAPVGYKNNVGEGTLRFDPVKAPLVKEAFNLMATGNYSADYVRKVMAKKGLKGTKSTFNHLLRNPFYIGKIVVPANEKFNEPEEIVIGIHEPLIDEGIFAEVQAIFNGRRRKFPPSQKKSENLPLRGHLICSICGKPLTGSGSRSRSKDIYFYYHCQHGCKERFRADSANELFKAYLTTFQIPNGLLALYSKVLEDVFKIEDAERKEKMKRLAIEKDAMRNRLNTLHDKFVDEQIEFQDYQTTKRRYEDSLNNMVEEYTECLMEKSTYLKYIDYGFTMLSNLSGYYANASLLIKQKIIGSIFPEKLSFDRKSYRTTKLNLLLTLNEVKINVLGTVGKRKADKTASFSKMVGPPGLEPGTT